MDRPTLRPSLSQCKCVPFDPNLTLHSIPWHSRLSTSPSSRGSTAVPVRSTSPAGRDEHSSRALSSPPAPATHACYLRASRKRRCTCNSRCATIIPYFESFFIDARRSSTSRELAFVRRGIECKHARRSRSLVWNDARRRFRRRCGSNSLDVLARGIRSEANARVQDRAAFRVHGKGSRCAQVPRNAFDARPRRHVGFAWTVRRIISTVGRVRIRCVYFDGSATRTSPISLVFLRRWTCVSCVGGPSNHSFNTPRMSSSR